jgi:flagellar assembly protein FliH
MAFGSDKAGAYCFPQLSEAAGRGRRAPERPEGDFRRSTLGLPGPGCRAEAAAGAAAESREEIEQAAYCRGFRDGERSGFEKGAQAGAEAAGRELREVKASLLGQIAELEGLRGRSLREAEEELLELALAVARKVVQHELAVRPDSVAVLLRRVLAGLSHASRVVVRMHPEDIRRLAGLEPISSAGAPPDGRPRFEPDPSVTPGGFRVETDLGDVDARIERRFQAVEEAFRQTLAAAADPGKGSAHAPGD